MHNRKILIIGEVYVDQHLDIIENGYSTSRLGGIFHAARSCDALNIEYALAYYAPDYLVKDVEKFGIDVLRAPFRCRRRCHECEGSRGDLLS